MTTPKTPVPSRAAVTPAVERERDRVIQALATHYAYDRITLEGFEERLDLAYRATTPAELRTLVADLPAAAEETRAEGSRRAPSPAAAGVTGAGAGVTGAAPPRGFAMAILGGCERKGTWTVPRHFKVVTVMGGAEIDLREARFGPGVTEIELFVLMGGVEVLAPPGVRVECDMAAVMGGFSSAADDDALASPAQPVVRLTGFVMWGGVEVQTRFPGESSKAYNRRRKLERRLRSDH